RSSGFCFRCLPPTSHVAPRTSTFAWERSALLSIWAQLSAPRSGAGLRIWPASNLRSLHSPSLACWRHWCCGRRCRRRVRSDVALLRAVGFEQAGKFIGRLLLTLADLFLIAIDRVRLQQRFLIVIAEQRHSAFGSRGVDAELGEC